METPLTSIYAVGGTAIALIPGLLWRLSGQGFRMANSGEELLDLFEDRYCVPQERVLQKKGDAASLAGYLLASGGGGGRRIAEYNADRRLAAWRGRAGQ